MDCSVQVVSYPGLNVNIFNDNRNVATCQFQHDDNDNNFKGNDNTTTFSSEKQATKAGNIENGKKH